MPWVIIAAPPMVLKEDPENERISPMPLSQAGHKAKHDTGGM